MENASKALIIAGGVLLAMMILALLVYAGTVMDSMADSQDRNAAAQQLEEFNKSYDSYNKTRLYGTDVLTVSNKAAEDGHNDYHIEIIATDEAGNNIPIADTHEFKISIFRCTEVSYSNTTGRIERMKFVKIGV